MPELVFYGCGGEVLRVTLEHRRLVLGRGELCDIFIPEPHVSRQQVALHFDGTRCLLEDLSGHGTRVLGELLRVCQGCHPVLRPTLKQRRGLARWMQLLAEYADVTHFIRLFRRVHGVTPAAWRRRVTAVP